MATERQIQANRRNAQCSTGPRTPEGKAKVVSNALTHGLTAKQVVLPHEDPEEFEAFARALGDELAPAGAVERLLVEIFVSDAWRRMRIPKLETALHARTTQETIIENLELEVQKSTSDHDLLLGLIGAAKRKHYLQANARLQAAMIELEEQPPLNATRVFERHGPEFANLNRHEVTLQRSMFQALHELQRLKLERAGEAVPAPEVLDISVGVNPELASIPDSEPTPPARQDERKKLD